MGMYTFLTVDRDIKLQKMFNDVDSAATNKALVLEAITKAFNMSYDDVLLYYSGHGRQKDGAWCFEAPGSDGSQDEYVTPLDIVEAWQARNAKHADQKLIIVSDSCHSGWWVDFAKKVGRTGTRASIVRQHRVLHRQQ